jgi:ribosomal protein L3 glutamine methyltransferase
MSKVLSIVPKSKAEYLEMTQNFKTILDFYRFGLSIYSQKSIFLGHGTDDIQIELSSLILGSLNLPLDWPEHFWIARLTQVEKEFLATQLYKRFESQIPTPYLIQKANFCGLEFFVDERVLIPRSPIAELIQAQFMPWVEPNEVSHILDLCTGGGCIAAACAFAYPEARVDAIDIDKNALDVAAINIQNLGLADQVRLIQSDGFQALTTEKYDIIVSNPPYVGADEMQTLPQEYLHEPRHALEAHDNGLALVHHIISQAKKHLKPEGILVVEVGNSDFAVMDAYPDLPFIWLEFEHGGHGVFLLHANDLP